MTSMSDLWRPIAELADRYEGDLLLCAPELVDFDCNPRGVGMGYFQDGGLSGDREDGAWVCAKWSMTNDEWYQVECNPTHFARIEGPREIEAEMTR